MLPVVRTRARCCLVLIALLLLPGMLPGMGLGMIDPASRMSAWANESMPDCPGCSGDMRVQTPCPALCFISAIAPHSGAAPVPASIRSAYGALSSWRLIEHRSAPDPYPPRQASL